MSLRDEIVLAFQRVIHRNSNEAGNERGKDPNPGLAIDQIYVEINRIRIERGMEKQVRKEMVQEVLEDMAKEGNLTIHRQGPMPLYELGPPAKDPVKT